MEVQTPDPVIVSPIDTSSIFSFVHLSPSAFFLLELFCDHRNNCCSVLIRSSQRSSRPVSPSWGRLQSTFLLPFFFSLLKVAETLSYSLPDHHSLLDFTLIRGFGPQTLNPKPILKAIPKIFAHADNSVRAEGFKLVVELRRWLGVAIDPFLSELKPVQV